MPHRLASIVNSSVNRASGPGRAPVPTRTAAAWFWLRVARQVVLREMADRTRGRPIKHRAKRDALSHAPLLAEHRSPLWEGGSAEEFGLLAGKVHNLRLAAAAFDGVVIPAGETFSFWRQLGRPSASRGYRVGREIRAGCVVPTVAGGLCQLSNALAHVAEKAGLELVERWRHTARPDTAGRDERLAAGDATVFWNYLDLRWRAAQALRIEVELDDASVSVRLRAERQAAMPIAVPISVDRNTGADGDAPAARGCLTCHETSCFRHGRFAPVAGARGAALLDAWQPEWAAWLAREAPLADRFEPWLRAARSMANDTTTSRWGPRSPASTRFVAHAAGWIRVIDTRLHRGAGGARQAALQRDHTRLARAYAKRLQPEHRHLIVDQALLVPLACAGVLGGRSYDVLASALPAAEIQRRLDVASARWPDDATLRDFRIEPSVAAHELQLLARARRIVTPHAEVARQLRAMGAQVERVEWHASPKPVDATERCERVDGTTVAFPASALGRKGVHELAAALRTLGWRALVLGTPAADARIWHGVKVEHAAYASDWLRHADVVALPTHIEHAPRAALRARAAGLPLVVTPACGIDAGDGVFVVNAGDVDALRAALVAAAAWRPAR